MSSALFPLNNNDVKLIPSIGWDVVNFFRPANSKIVGSKSVPITGALHCEFGFISGPLTINGTRIPPYKRLHFPPLKGLLILSFEFGFGGKQGTAPLSEVKMTYVFFDNPNSSKELRTSSMLRSKASVIAE